VPESGSRADTGTGNGLRDAVGRQAKRIGGRLETWTEQGPHKTCLETERLPLEAHLRRLLTISPQSTAQLLLEQLLFDFTSLLCGANNEDAEEEEICAL
jgi:hypothetical protein